MTHIKHIIVLVLLLLTFGFSAKAQGTALLPNEGTTHTYTWNGLQEGVGYQFYVAADNNGSVIYDDGATEEFEFITSPTGTLGVGDNAASVEIKWNIRASLNIYFVWLKLTGTNGCTNFRYVRVRPQPGFDLLSENMPVGNTTSCPDITSVAFNPLATAYNAGASTLRFKVKREFGTDNTGTPAPGDTYNWSFIPELEVLDFVAGLDNVIIKVEGTTSGEIAAVGNRYSVNGFDDEVIVTVSIDNAPGTIRNVTLKVTLGVEDTTNLSDNNHTNDNVTHTIHVMPLIGGMGGV